MMVSPVSLGSCAASGWAGSVGSCWVVGGAVSTENKGAGVSSGWGDILSRGGCLASTVSVEISGLGLSASGAATGSVGAFACSSLASACACSGWLSKLVPGWAVSVLAVSFWACAVLFFVGESGATTRSTSSNGGYCSKALVPSSCEFGRGEVRGSSTKSSSSLSRREDEGGCVGASGSSRTPCELSSSAA